MTEGLWSAFLRGSAVSDEKNIPNPHPALMTESHWELAKYLSLNFDAFKGLHSHIENNGMQWEIFAEHLTEIPSVFNLNSFEKLVLTKIFRPEKVLHHVSAFVEQILGAFYLESPDKSMDTIYKDSTVKTPVIFVLSPGADPTQ